MLPPLVDSRSRPAGARTVRQVATLRQTRGVEFAWIFRGFRVEDWAREMSRDQRRMQPGSSVEFPPFRLDLANHELWRGEERLVLRPKPFAVLAYLATHASRLVSRDELAQAVWPDTHVGDGLLRGYVRDVRMALGDDAAAPRFIETVARLGYRFLAPVRPVDGVVVPDVLVGTGNGTPGMVGRAAELGDLARRLALAIAGRRQLVLVTGEPGIGKTTLVDVFLARAVNGSDIWTARGQCVEHFGAAEAYLPVLEALGRLGRLPGGEQVVAILARHAPTWLVQMPGLITDAELETVQRRVQGATRERMLRELAEAVEVLTAERPLLLVLEDLQWSDDSTLDLLSSLAQRREEARLLMLGTYRPADVVAGVHPLASITRELRQHGQCAEVALAALDEPDVSGFLAHRFARHQLAPDLAQAIYQATEGNPLFVVNLVDYWIARGVLVEHDGRWGIDAGLTAVASRVPDTLRHMIERQLDRLPPETRGMLEAASVVGREFSTGTVAAALGEAQDRVDDRCETLAARGLVLRARGIADLSAGGVAGRYGFLHALYQQVLYERLAPARRVRLHRRIGEIEESAYGARVQEHAAELALHFERGHDHRRALRHLELAARNAVAKHAHHEAAALLGRSLDILPHLPDATEAAQAELPLRMALGTSLFMTRGYAAPAVEHEFARAHELSRHMDGSPELVFALAGLFRFFFSRAKVQLAREVADQVLHLAEAHDRSLLAVGHSLTGLPLLSVGEFAMSRQHLEQAIALYDVEQHRSIATRHGDDPALTALAFLAIGLWSLGYPEQALERSREGEALAVQIGAPYSIAFARGFTIWVHVRRGEPAQARARSEALMGLAAEQGFTFFADEASIFRGWAIAEQGDA